MRKNKKTCKNKFQGLKKHPENRAHFITCAVLSPGCLLVMKSSFKFQEKNIIAFLVFLFLLHLTF